MGIKKETDIVTKPTEKLYGPSKTPCRYSSAGTRYVGLHGLQQGAEFNEVNDLPGKQPGAMPDDWKAMGIRSGVNQRDCPSTYGIDAHRGNDRIGGAVFTADWIRRGWRRIKGESVG